MTQKVLAQLPQSDFPLISVEFFLRMLGSLNFLLVSSFWMVSYWKIGSWWDGTCLVLAILWYFWNDVQSKLIHALWQFSHAFLLFCGFCSIHSFDFVSSPNVTDRCNMAESDRSRSPAPARNRGEQRGLDAGVRPELPFFPRWVTPMQAGKNKSHPKLANLGNTLSA